jgi:hypothetical protein
MNQAHAREPWPASGIALVVGLYLGLHLLVRLALGGALGFDDAEQALFAQTLAPGYRTAQPPLYTWLLVASIELFGANLFAVILPRYLLLGLTFLFIYLVGRRWIGDQRHAALALFSFALIYVFAYYAHHDLTHTTALGAAIAAAFYAFALIVEQPSSTLRYALLGLIFGFGLLSKWNFVMLALGLPLTCLLDRRFRALVLTPRVLVALAVMALVVAPTALWVLDQGATPGSVSASVLLEPEGAGRVLRLLDGTFALALAVLLFPMPFLIVFAVLFGPAARRGFARWRERAAPAGVVPPGFLLKLIGVTLFLHWLLVPALGADAFTARWMHPVLMIVPVLAFQLAAAGARAAPGAPAAPHDQRPDGRALRIYLIVTVLFVALALGVRVIRHVRGADHCGRCREMAPFAELAAQLRRLGFEEGTIVADGMHAAGNLSLRFGDSRVLDPAFPASVFPPATGHGQCLAVWPEEGRTASMGRERVERYLQNQLAAPWDAAPVRGEVSAPMAGSSSRMYRLGYAYFAAGAGDCR